MSTTLITGGAGFLGSHLAERLAARGDRVVVLDDLSSGDPRNLPDHLGPRLEFVRGPVTDASLIDSLVRRVDRVFHLAAVVGVKLLATNPIGVVETNVLGTTEVLRACARYRRPVLITSSSEVYGKSAERPFSEEADVTFGPPTKARWPYACSKALGEHLGLAYFREMKLSAVVARLFNVSGPRQVGTYGMVIPRFVEQALQERPITVYGDGSQRRCFCHVDDVVPALAGLLETPQASGRVVNLGGYEAVTIRRLAELVKELTNSRSDIVNVPFEEAYGAEFEDMHDREPDISLARALIGYEPRRSLSDIVSSVIEYQRDAGEEPESPTVASVAS